MKSGETIGGYCVRIELTGLADRGQKWMARVHLGKGPEALRFAYGADKAEAIGALKAQCDMESLEGSV